MIINLYDAHRQWALRLPDERFPSLESLHSFTEDRKNFSIEAQRVPKQIDLKVLPQERKSPKWLNFRGLNLVAGGGI